MNPRLNVYFYEFVTGKYANYLLLETLGYCVSNCLPGFIFFHAFLDYFVILSIIPESSHLYLIILVVRCIYAEYILFLKVMTRAFVCSECVTCSIKSVNITACVPPYIRSVTRVRRHFPYCILRSVSGPCTNLPIHIYVTTIKSSCNVILLLLLASFSTK